MSREWRTTGGSGRSTRHPSSSLDTQNLGMIKCYGGFLRNTGKWLTSTLLVKRTKKGTRFGFVRFMNVTNVSELEERLAGIHRDNRKIIINLAKFEKNDKTRDDGDKKEHVSGRSSFVGTNQVGLGKSFSDAVSGRPPSHSPFPNDRDQVIVFQPIDENTNKLKKSLVGKAINLDTLHNIYHIFKAEGFSDASISYLGGMSVVIRWSIDVEAIDMLEKNKVWLNKWLTDVKPWDEDSVCHGRLVRLKIEGLPAQA